MGIFEGLEVAVTGFLIVFSILIILMVVIYMFKFLFGKKEKKDGAVSSAVASEATDNTLKPKTISEKKLVAIATAAIAASRGSSDCAFDVISIQKLS